MSLFSVQGCVGGSLCYDKCPPASFCPSESQLLKREPPVPPFPSPRAAVTEHINAARARGMGVGGRPGCGYCSEGAKPPILPFFPYPLRAARAHSNRRQRHRTPHIQTHTRRSPLPPQRSFPECPPVSSHTAPIQSYPWKEGAAQAPLAQLDWVQHPGPRPAAAAGEAALAGGPGQGLRDWGVYLLVRRNILPPGKEGIEKLESAVQRESDMTRRRRHGGRCGSGGGAGASALGGGWSRCGQGRAGEGRAVRAACREGALLGTSAASPSPAGAWRLNPGGRRGAQPRASLPKAHLLLFRGRGKSFWKAKEQKGRGQHRPPAASRRPSQTPGGACHLLLWPRVFVCLSFVVLFGVVAWLGIEPRSRC